MTALLLCSIGVPYSRKLFREKTFTKETFANSFGYAHVQSRSFYPLSTFDGAHVRKDIRLSPPARLQCSRSEAWEPGNEAKSSLLRTSNYVFYIPGVVLYTLVPHTAFS